MRTMDDITQLLDQNKQIKRVEDNILVDLGNGHEMPIKEFYTLYQLNELFGATGICPLLNNVCKYDLDPCRCLIDCERIRQIFPIDYASKVLSDWCFTDYENCSFFLDPLGTENKMKARK